MSDYWRPEVTVETWRSDDSTFFMLYPTADICAIKGLRGELSIRAYKELARRLRDKGIRLAIYERENPDGSKTTRIIEVSKHAHSI